MVEVHQTSTSHGESLALLSRDNVTAATLARTSCGPSPVSVTSTSTAFRDAPLSVLEPRLLRVADEATVVGPHEIHEAGYGHAGLTNFRGLTFGRSRIPCAPS
jgi:hypothetical protein